MKKQYQFHWISLLLALGLAFLGMSVLSIGLQVYAAPTTNSFWENIAANSRLSLRQFALANKANLAPNPDFEEETGDWPNNWAAINLFKTSAGYIAGNAHSGSHAIRLESGKSNGQGTWQSDMITIEPDYLYSFSGWVRNDGATGGYSMLKISFRDAADNEVDVAESERRSDAMTDWTQITATGFAPENAVRIRLEAHTQGAIIASFDDVSLLGAEAVVPILRIKVNDAPDPVREGETLTYTLIITNEGNAPETGFTVTLAMDENIVLDGVNPATTTMSGEQLVWGNPDTGLDVGEVHTITVNTHLLEELDNVLQLSSFATVTGKIANTNVIDEVVTAVDSFPYVELSKTAPTTVTAGERLTYTIRVTNTSNALAEYVFFAEVYPSNTSCFNSAGLPPVWTIADLAPGESATTVLSGEVGLGCPGGSVINNRVNISVQPGGQTANASAQTGVEGDFDPCLGIALHAPNPDQIWTHETHTYLFELENTCTLPASNLTLTMADSLGWPDEHFSITPTLVGNLAAGEIQVISVTGITTPCTPSGLLNTLTLTATNPLTLSATADLTLTVGANPGGDIQTGMKYVLPAAGQFTLTHLITNTGNTTTTFLFYNDEQMLPGWSRQWKPDPMLTLPPCQSGSRDSLLTYPGDYLTTTIPTKLANNSGDNELFDVAFDTLSVEKFWQMALAPLPADTPCRLSPDAPTACRFQLSNTGNQPLSNFLIEMTDTLKWGGAYLALSTGSAATLWPDANRTITVTAQIPENTPGGATNTLTLDVTSAAITAAADLEMIVSVSHRAELASTATPEPALPGQPLTIAYILTNTSNAAASFVLTASDSLGWDLTTSPTATTQLDPGETQAIEVSGVMVGCVLSGTVNPLILNATPIDGDSPVATATTHLVVGQWTGAQLTPGSQYVAPPNQILTITHQLTNTGNVTTSFTLSTVAPAGWTVNWPANAAANVAPCGGIVAVRTTVSHPEVDYASESLTTTVTPAGAPGNIVAQAVDQVLLRWYMVYLPLCLKEPPLPAIPTIDAIINPDINGDYMIQWNATTYATYYILEESGNAEFNPATEITRTEQQAINIANTPAGAHYYRVSACNLLDKCSAWSAAAFMEAWYEHEPNDATSSNGPLNSGMLYYGRPNLYQNDQNDYFMFRTTGAGQITVNLTGYTGKGGWLLMYDGKIQSPADASILIKADGSAAIVYNGDAGNYYVRIYTESGFNDTPYTLTVTFPQTRQHGLPETLSFR